MVVGVTTVLGTFLVLTGINQVYGLSVFALNLVIGLGLGLAIDYTLFFRRLCDFDSAPEARNDELRDMFIDPAAFDAWAGEYRERLRREGDSDANRGEQMRAVNPKFVLRNHVAQLVIEAAEAGDFSETDALLKVLQNPFDEHAGMERFAEPPPAGSQKVVVSCSS